MDSSRGLDRHSLATWAAASEARSAQPVKPLHRRRWQAAVSPPSDEEHVMPSEELVMPSEEDMVQSPCAPRESCARSERCRDIIRARKSITAPRRRRARARPLVVVVVVIIHTREGIIPLLCNAAVEYCVRIIIYVYVG